MKCPRCKTGLMVPDRSYDVPALHCMSCGDLFMEERPVVMPEIPPKEIVYSSNPKAIYDRELRARIAANGGKPLGRDHLRKITHKEERHV